MISSFGKDMDSFRRSALESMTDKFMAAEPGSRTEFELSCSAVTSITSALSSRDRYLFALYGREVAEDPAKVVPEYDDLEATVRKCLGQPGLIHEASGLVRLGRLAGEIEYDSRIGRATGDPTGSLTVPLSSSFMTKVIHGQLVPSMTSANIDHSTSRKTIEEGSTRVATGGGRYEHERDRHDLHAGQTAVRKWLDENTVGIGNILRLMLDN
ncbi:MAG TPA: hypothetical protein VLG37_05395 [Candidatus Saccharimonadales bacterium]|nr:hypothetical protein [Candidatus Saccharimonadales bacterium]